jgi:hypothetical protein
MNDTENECSEGMFLQNEPNFCNKIKGSDFVRCWFEDGRGSPLSPPASGSSTRMAAGRVYVFEGRPSRSGEKRCPFLQNEANLL